MVGVQFQVCWRTILQMIWVFPEGRVQTKAAIATEELRLRDEAARIAT
jgi:hypothetical protein